MVIIRNLPAISKLKGMLSKANRDYTKKLAQYLAEGNYKEEQELLRYATSKWGKEFFETFNAPLTITGTENLPKEGPVLYVSNHQSYCDIPALFGALDTVQFGFVAKDNLKSAPIIGPWLARTHSLLLERDNPKAALKTMNLGAEEMEKGYSFLIFPEGTRAKCDTMNEFKPGALRMAIKAKCPIIPVSLNGTYKMYEETGVFHGEPVHIKIHPPIETANLDKKEQKAIPAKVFEIVQNGLEELKAEMNNSRVVVETKLPR